MNEPRDIQQRTFEFATRLVRLCRALDEAPGVSRTLANQLLRSGTSVGANVEEAHGSQSKPDFIAKMSIANKEAREKGKEREAIRRLNPAIPEEARATIKRYLRVRLGRRLNP